MFLFVYNFRILSIHILLIDNRSFVPPVSPYFVVTCYLFYTFDRFPHYPSDVIHVLCALCDSFQIMCSLRKIVI